MREDYRKYSRKYGWMVLRSYAPGDGSIDFVWAAENDQNGPALNHPVTESDVSEWLELEDNKKIFDKWIILEMGSIKPQVRIAQQVVRPFHTSKVLEMGGVKYDYVFHGDEGRDFSVTNTTFYNDHEKVENMNTAVGLCFFLNHEIDFDKNGYETRRKR